MGHATPAALVALPLTLTWPLGKRLWSPKPQALDHITEQRGPLRERTLGHMVRQQQEQKIGKHVLQCQLHRPPRVDRWRDQNVNARALR